MDFKLNSNCLKASGFMGIKYQIKGRFTPQSFVFVLTIINPDGRKTEDEFPCLKAFDFCLDYVFKYAELYDRWQGDEYLSPSLKETIKWFVGLYRLKTNNDMNMFPREIFG